MNSEESNVNRLNEKQQEAATHTKGPLVIVAGAGTGKTSTLTRRIANLIKTGVAPERILAVTFTNKAAHEMKDRVHELIKDEVTQSTQPDENGFLPRQSSPFMSTFHALGVHILRGSGKHMGIERHFTILDKSASLSIIKQIVKGQGINPKEFPPEKILRAISNNKSELTDLATFEKASGRMPFSSVAVIVWRSYEEELAKQHALDFDDLITKAVVLLQTYPEVRKHYLRKWQYLHIDEYQDTNTAQYELARNLVGKDNNICVVGDADQLIYGWRGADINNILNFEKDYPNATTIILEENYRSTQRILAAANDIIKKNKKRTEKNLFTKNIEGEKISLFEAFDEKGEARFVATKSRELIKSGVSPKDIAVLYRANFQSRILEEAFLIQEVPYHVLGVKFFDRKEVKDILAFIRAGINPNGRIDVERVSSVPPRGIGKVTLEKMIEGREEELSPAMRARVEKFKALLGVIGASAQTQKVSDLIKIVLIESGLEKALRDGNDEDAERLENIQELVTLSSKYDVLPVGECVEKFLEDAALASDQDSLEKSEDAVRLMTVHASKGLEFPYVFITGMEEGLFPHERMGERITADKSEEERRLFYVALTRAKKKLFLSQTSIRMIFGQEHINLPSEFITDLEEHLESETMDDNDVPTINF